jgi:hypothetical protein
MTVPPAALAGGAYDRASARALLTPPPTVPKRCSLHPRLPRLCICGQYITRHRESTRRTMMCLCHEKWPKQAHAEGCATYRSVVPGDTSVHASGGSVCDRRVMPSEPPALVMVTALADSPRPVPLMSMAAPPTVGSTTTGVLTDAVHRTQDDHIPSNEDQRRSQTHYRCSPNSTHQWLAGCIGVVGVTSSGDSAPQATPCRPAAQAQPSPGVPRALPCLAFIAFLKPTHSLHTTIQNYCCMYTLCLISWETAATTWWTP